MVRVRTAMGPAMVYLMLAGAIRGFAEALALADVSVGAGVEAAAEVGLVIGGRFELASNPLWVNCRKEGFLCQEAMVQVLAAKGPAQGVV